MSRHPPPPAHRHPASHYHRHRAPLTVDTGLSDDTFTDTASCLDYYQRIETDRSWSDEESASTRIPPLYDDFDAPQRPAVHKNGARVHPAPSFVPQQATFYRQVPSPPIALEPLRRPASSMSSGVTSAIVDGCGGKCQTCENVCYFFLQLLFMMGILIGISLCIAGLVLRKSAARNLQVLVYIGILLAIVSGSLLGIQWNARSVAKKRKMAIQNAKRTPIMMETLSRPVGEMLVATQEGNRIVPDIVRDEEQGIPWWRRRDVV